MDRRGQGVQRARRRLARPHSPRRASTPRTANTGQSRTAGIGRDMALTNKERIGRMLDVLAAGLKPVVEQAFTKAYGSGWISTIDSAKGPGVGAFDPNDPRSLLNALW